MNFLCGRKRPPKIRVKWDDQTTSELRDTNIILSFHDRKVWKELAKSYKEYYPGKLTYNEKNNGITKNGPDVKYVDLNDIADALQAKDITMRKALGDILENILFGRGVQFDDRVLDKILTRISNKLNIK